ncbi:MAG: UDP-galactopyranose mutase [Spirochaetes bacterium]|jgi:UDP-galactopyranose mutase|nr:UDP-galactopyranose mutase [Spirochaetota bacterium]
MYDYLIVGAGLFGSIFAHQAKKRGKSVLVVDKRQHVGGNLYCQDEEGINIHKYGPHVFHTANIEVWDYINDFVSFNNFQYSPMALYQGWMYNLPCNMNTLNKLWSVVNPEEARARLESQRVHYEKPLNLEEQALSIYGKDIYEKLVKDFAEKLTGTPCEKLPPIAALGALLPLRYTYDNRYHTDTWQGIPVGGYNPLFDNLLSGIALKLDTDFFENRDQLTSMAHRVVYTGNIDQYFDYRFGSLDYYGLYYEHELVNTRNHQGTAVIFYTGKEVPYTRIIEHKHFERGRQPITIVTHEYPASTKKGGEPCYPVKDSENHNRYIKYRELADAEAGVIFGGRLSDYTLYSMEQTFINALALVKNELAG